MNSIGPIHNTSLSFRLAERVCPLLQRIKELFFKVIALISGRPPLPRHGIPNWGNSCYMASVLQSLVSVNSVAKTTWGKKPLPQTIEETQAHLTHYYTNGWAQGMNLQDERNAYEFVEYLLPQIAVQATLYSITSRQLEIGKSIQDLASHRLRSDLFIVCVEGRALESGYRNETPLIASEELHGKYALRAVVVHNGRKHYYSLVQNGSGWTEYNDANVTQHAQSDKINQLIQTSGYLFFYEKK